MAQFHGGDEAICRGLTGQLGANILMDDYGVRGTFESLL